MSADTGEEATTLAPDAAFSVLGNETRMEILQTLGAVDEPLSFSELRDRVGVSDSGQFNYHLGQLTGHFVRQTDDGYSLRQAGSRVIEAVLSGAVTETVVLDPTRLENICPYCRADVEISYREERLLVRCTECAGSFGEIESSSDAFGTLPEGTITLNYLPSAGFQERTPHELFETALAWSLSESLLEAKGICPRCSATLDHWVDVCDDHEGDKPICARCNTRLAVRYASRCTNCNKKRKGGFNLYLLGNPQLRSFYETHGVDPLAPDWKQNPEMLIPDQEEVLETDPFEARFTFIVDGDALSLTVDDDLNVVEVEEHEASEPDW